MQSKVSSLLESLMNTGIGYFTAIATQLLIFPVYGIDISVSQNLTMGLVFTVVAIARSYIIRRWFNNRVHQAAMMMSE